jgi:hypothetical protein
VEAGEEKAGWGLARPLGSWEGETTAAGRSIRRGQNLLSYLFAVFFFRGVAVGRGSAQFLCCLLHVPTASSTGESAARVVGAGVSSVPWTAMRTAERRSRGRKSPRTRMEECDVPIVAFGPRTDRQTGRMSGVAIPPSPHHSTGDLTSVVRPRSTEEWATPTANGFVVLAGSERGAVPVDVDRVEVRGALTLVSLGRSGGRVAGWSGRTLRSPVPCTDSAACPACLLLRATVLSRNSGNSSLRVKTARCNAVSWASSILVWVWHSL